jgi:hypothetical protein
MGLRTYLDNKTCFDEISHQTHGSNEFKLQFLLRNQTIEFYKKFLAYFQASRRNEIQRKLR